MLSQVLSITILGGPPAGAAFFFVSFVLIGTLIVLNLVIGVIMKSMDESHAEMNVKKKSPEERKPPNRFGMELTICINDLRISNEMQVIKKMIEKQQEEA